MTTPVLALEKLWTDVQALFAAEAGARGLPETSHFTGTASIAGTPTAASETRIRFTVGGTVGVAGIFYRVSTDDGATYGAATALGVATTIVVLGVTLTISGTVVADDFVRWTQNGPALPVFQFGTREPAKRGDRYRVVFVPGDDSGNAGTLVAARNPGRNPRPLHTLDELFTVYCDAYDSTAPENELAQWKAARLLWDAVIRAIYVSARGTYSVISTLHMVDRSTRRHAWTMRSVISIQSMVPDAPAFILSPPQVSLTVGLEVAGSNDPAVVIEP